MSDLYELVRLENQRKHAVKIELMQKHGYKYNFSTDIWANDSPEAISRRDKRVTGSLIEACSLADLKKILPALNDPLKYSLMLFDESIMKLIRVSK